MPVSKTAPKEIRASEKRRLRNKSMRSLNKTNITKAEKLIQSGDPETARKAVVEAIRSLDKAAEKKIIHANNAARRKSRIMSRLSKLSAAPKSEQTAGAAAKPVRKPRTSTRAKKKATT